MSVTRVLLDILVVLLAAKAAAEVAERVGVPAVVGEILAGVLIGPSVLGLVKGEDTLRVLGELGVILLLLQVGLEMDLAELGAVGRASMTVACVGVVIPFAAGYGVGLAWGMTGNEALFVGAALTATSVGITARVFGDLGALAAVEARTVLGAAVADDVLGLVILTVVVRLVSAGGVSPLEVVGVVAVATAFIVLTSVMGVRIAPQLFAFVARYSRSSGTLVAVALAFTLGFAELANAAKLAPIVGAFVAGVSLARSSAAERIRRELTPVGHLFIPVFFLQIGIDAEVGQFGHGKVLGLAAALLVVAVAGKLASAVGLRGAPGDRLLVGIGMIPRGEVGLIFATLGLREHVFGEDVYAALLLVVLATTLLTPPVLRWRHLRVRAGRVAGGLVATKPPGGWLVVRPGPAGGVVDLAAEPPPGEALEIALEAALEGNRQRPGPRLLDWLSSLPAGPLRWNDAARKAFFRLLAEGSPRAWRFLALTGVLDRALPDLGHALARRQADPLELDPTAAMRWPRLARVQQLLADIPLPHSERVLLAALVLDAEDDRDAAIVTARRIVQRLDLGAAAEQAVAALVADAPLLRAAARRIDSTSEERILQLAVHLGSSEQATALYLLTLADDDLEPLERQRLDEVYELVQAALRRPELTGRQATNALERRRAEARSLVPAPAVRERIDAAPRAYVLATAAADLARQAALCEPTPGAGTVRADVTPVDASTWRVDLVARDRVGLLARETDVLAGAGLDILDALVVTWGDGCALGSFVVRGAATPDGDALANEVAGVLDRPLTSPAAPEVSLLFDDDGSPWHTLCIVEAPDRPALLHALTTAFAASGASVHSARVMTVGGAAVDEFGLTDRNGRKLSDRAKEAIRDALASGVKPRRGWRRRRVGDDTRPSETVKTTVVEPQPVGHNGEIPTSYGPPE